MKSSVRVSKQTKKDFYDNKQTKIVVDYFNLKYIYVFFGSVTK